MLFSCRALSRLGLILASAIPFATAVRAQVTDPVVTEWVTARSYARVYTTTANKTAGTSATTWSGVTSPFYSDIQRVVYSNNYVYLYATGMPSYVAGNWLTPNGAQYGSWPKNRAAIHRIPRTVSIPATKQKTNGNGGVLLNGVFVWANGDAQSYDNVGDALTATTATISMSGDGIWNRLAGVAEDFNFDPAKGHHPSNGAYHNHVNPLGLRYQLGDAVTYNSSTKAYAEGAPTAHSPLLGFANDGLPIYGPYGYATATNSSSGIRRMVSGFVKRNGATTNKTTNQPNTNLASTGRTTLPVWAASVQGKSTTLSSSEYGPNTTATYANGLVNYTASIGVFAEDYDYLGDLGYTQGTDFDLNRQNVRYCVTPEYPSGTYAYFVCIDSTGTTVFPDIINQEFYGSAAMGPGTVTSITETVTEYLHGGQASPLTLSAATASGGSGVTLTWPSVEGATYTAASSTDGTNYTTLSSTLSGTLGGTATYTTATVAPYYKITFSALATYDSTGNGSVTGLNTSATATYSLGSANRAPTLDDVGNFNGEPEDTATTLSYETLAALCNEADADGDALFFRIESLGSGTLTKNGSAVTVGTLLSAGDSFVWTPPANGYGDFVAFTFTAYDGALASTPAATLTIHIAAMNDAPTLTTVSTIDLSAAGRPYELSYASLANAADEADLDTETILFRIETVASGMLTKDGAVVVPGTTTLAFGETLIWTPAASATGTVTAFTLRAYDGALASATAVAVPVTVGALVAPTITEGPGSDYVFNGESYELSVHATGSGPLNYQWYKSGAPISGATSATYTIEAAILDLHNGSYTVTVTNDAGSVTSTPATLLVLDNSKHTAWTVEYFTLEELLAGTITTDTADPDADGIPNLLEYAFGLHPRDPDTSPLTVTVVANHLQLSFPRLTDDPDIVYSVEASSDLSTWTPATTTELSATAIPDTNREQVTLRDETTLTTSSRRFLRLRIDFD